MSKNKIVDELQSSLLTSLLLQPTKVGSSERIWTINEWLLHTREWLEKHYQRFWLRGEISNFTQAASGHMYFVLKEQHAQIRCVCFRMSAQRCALKLRNGIQVEVFAQATVYEERGDLQLRIEQIREVGIGDLWQQFLALKAKLDALGWFDTVRKSPLPPHPQRIGLITSPQAAALRDVLATLRHRAPSVQIILYPAPVQGEAAAERLAQAVHIACMRAEVDVLILCRGGGSLEDLAAFNDERLARAVYEATIPVISGIGHETDFSIVDFVADVRAPTPTGAAVMVVPDERELQQRLYTIAQRLFGHLRHRLEREQLRVDHLGQQLRSPRERLNAHRQHLHHFQQRWLMMLHRTLPPYQQTLKYRLQRFQTLQPLPNTNELHRRFERLKAAGFAYLQHAQLNISRLDARYQASNPMAPLDRGYAVVSTLPPKAHFITSIKGLATGEPLQVSLRDGTMHVTITSLTPANVKERTSGLHPNPEDKDNPPSDSAL